MAPQEALKTLGLTPTATPEEIRQAYRDLVKVWHPERFGTDARLRAKAEDHLKEINKAFDLLEASDFRTDAEPPPLSPSRSPLHGRPALRGIVSRVGGSTSVR